jgi:hypothetical protein
VDGRFMAAAGIDGAVRGWPVTGGEPRTLRGHRGGITSVAVAPRGSIVTGVALAAWLAAQTNVRTESADELQRLE